MVTTVSEQFFLHCPRPYTRRMRVLHFEQCVTHQTTWEHSSMQYRIHVYARMHLRGRCVFG